MVYNVKMQIDSFSHAFLIYSFMKEVKPVKEYVMGQRACVSE